MLRLIVALACVCTGVCAAECSAVAAEGQRTPESDRAPGTPGVLDRTAGLYSGPEWESLMDAVTLRVSFDGGTCMPTMAAGSDYRPSIVGSYDPSRSAAPVFAPGLFGDALVLGSGAVSYPGVGDVSLDRQGAMAFWVEPLEWKRKNDGNVTFVIAAGGRFYVQRQGPLTGEDGKVRRQESIQYLAKASSDQALFTCLAARTWENGTWHLVVVNWAWPRMSLSIDGGAFATKSLPAPPAPMSGAIHIGSRGGSRALLDELVCFRRCLSLDEVRQLYALKSVAQARP